MILSAFLAKVIGLYLIVVSLLWMFRHKQAVAACKEVSTSKGLLAISAEYSLVFGLIIAVDHPVWSWGWQGLITLIGYLLILRGIMRLGFPAHVQKSISKFLRKGCWMIFLIFLGLGIYLTYCGFAYTPA